jgi:hypothetical protein
MADQAQAVETAQANVDEEKKTKELVEQTQHVEEANDEAALSGSIGEVDKANPINQRR